MTRIKWLPSPCRRPPPLHLFVPFPGFKQSEIFLRSVLNVFRTKEVGYIFEEPSNLHIFVFWLALFFLIIYR